MSTFREQLLGPKKDSVVADLVDLAERTVQAQSGLSGRLVKGAYAAARKVDENIAAKAAKQLLPEITEDLEPLWNSYVAAGQKGGFGPYLVDRKQQVAGLLLETADRKVHALNNSTARKIYSPVRGKLVTIVEDHVGDLGEVVEQHVNAAT
ncbi:hypothetical protein CUROG_05725 [Corynebacterium urogenitale]|uniref:Uncharacterized protein n=1 Tax=Corynebacterium urogenitale TaxID=2487892 RepID=A0A5J6Z5Z0_9CORY|nr:hypothetical protein [Corynebacterium urogenitale]QFQ02508.1 hypothetical protein CUROG_05725 [Corynebacterium urogenitale]